MERIISQILYTQQTTSLPLETILHSVLSKYTILPKKNELMTTDESWHGELLDYLKRQTIKGLRPKTIKQYKTILSNAFESIGKPTREITSMDISLYLAYMQNMRGASSRYMAGIRNILNGFFSWCVKSRMIEYNPIDGVDRVKFMSKKKKPFSEEEVERLRIACDQTRYPIRNRAMVELFYSSGLRCFELLSLNRSDISLENHVGFVDDGKGGKQGNFWFSDVAGYYLKKYLDTRKDDNPALFLSRNGHRFSNDDGVEYVIGSLGAIAGVENTNPHRFRHTCAQKCIDKGMSIQDVMVVLRHSNIATTEGYFIENIRRTQEEFRRVFN